ncbi:hypothetical protein, partial [Mesorhizobium sp.]|uniref:hypothetical protein n=1 Tax=Mesorhizobium sp. TaxID=1871066 RepID=UPI0025BEFF80
MTATSTACASNRDFVIHGRSKERSDVAETLDPCRDHAAALRRLRVAVSDDIVVTLIRLRSSAYGTERQLCSRECGFVAHDGVED